MNSRGAIVGKEYPSVPRREKDSKHTTAKGSSEKIPDRQEVADYFKGLLTSPIGSGTGRDERIKRAWRDAQKEGR